MGGALGLRGHRIHHGIMRVIEYRAVEEDGHREGIVSVVPPPRRHHCPVPVAGAAKVAGYRSEVPCELDADDFTRLLTGCDCGSDVGLHDRAILSILWRLGLRRGEVAGLRIDDIDWRRGEITIRGKANRHELLPIPIDVREALVRYLQEGHLRVPTGCRTLFFQMGAPEDVMSSAGVGDVVSRVSDRVGPPVMGAHRLRHGTATQLVRNGITWPENAQVMRPGPWPSPHLRPPSTRC